MQKRIYHWCEVGIGQIFPSGHCLASLGRASRCQNNDPWDRFAHPYLTLMLDSYNVFFLTLQNIAWKIEDLKAAEDEQNRKSLFDLDDHEQGKM